MLSPAFCSGPPRVRDASPSRDYSALSGFLRCRLPHPADLCFNLKYMNEWNIQSRAAACEACGQPFADKQPLHTLLFDERDDDLHRMDVCQNCWQNQFDDGARERKGFISHWQTVFNAPAPVVDPIQKDTAESLLRKLIE